MTRTAGTLFGLAIVALAVGFLLGFLQVRFALQDVVSSDARLAPEALARLLHAAASRAVVGALIAVVLAAAGLFAGMRPGHEADAEA